MNRLHESRLHDKRVLVTGAARGIGREIAARCASEGARVGIADLDEAGAHALADELGAPHSAVRVDIADERDVDACVAWHVQRFGGLDIVVHCAGIGVERAFLDIDLEEWERLLRINLTGTFLVARRRARDACERRR